jgi:aerobic C4-dicarboxylate transport protein
MAAVPHHGSSGKLYIQVLIAIAIGVLLGVFSPDTAVALRPLGDGFIKLIRMIIAPIIFATVVVGIARMGEMKEVGRVGVKALVYFEVVTTMALIIGLVVVNVLKPGVGINADPATLDAASVAAYANQTEQLGTVAFLLNIIPNTVVDAFARGEILQVLLFSVLFGLALLRAGKRSEGLVAIIDQFGHGMFAIVGMIMRLAPLGALGGMAFTIGRYGIGTLVQLFSLMLGVYTTCLLFVFVVLGSIARFTGFSLIKFLKYIKEEILIVLGTSSSETVLPRMIAKLEHLGCSKSVVGLVIPTGYSFNLDGTSIYLTMAAIFVAQATNVNLTLGDQLTVLAVLLLTSKGAAAVTGGGLITLAATLSSLQTVPVAGLALLLGVDRFMSEARAITNLIGNGVATVVVAKWDKGLNEARLRRILDGKDPEGTEEPEVAAEGFEGGRRARSA